jgi:hypothetical protein
MSLGIPIVTTFDNKGVRGAVREFQNLEGSAKKMGFAIRKATAPAAAALAGLGSAALKAAQMAGDLNETQSATNVVFGESAKVITDFSKRAAKELGLSQIAAQEAAQTFGGLAAAAGKTGPDVANFAEQMTKLSADMASFKNTTPEDAIQAIGAALRGEMEPIRRYNVLLDDQTLRNRALKMELIDSVKTALTPANKTLAAQAEILAQTSIMQGDFARTSGGAAGQQKILKAELDNTVRSIGQAFVPILETLLPLLSGMAGFADRNAALFVTFTIALGGFATAILASRGAMVAWNAIAIITKGINWALSTSFTAVQVATGVGIGVAIAAAGAFVIIKEKMDKARAAADNYASGLSVLNSVQWSVVRSQEQLSNFMGPVLTRDFKKLTTGMTDTETAAERLAKAKAKAAAEARKLADAAKKLKADIKDAKEELIRFFNETLDDAKEKLADATEAFADFAKSVSDSVLEILNFGSAQTTALGNAKDLTEAIKNQNKAQANLTKALALDNKTLTEQRKAYEELQEAFKSDDLEVRRKAQEAYNKAMEADPIENQTEALRDLEEANLAVAEAQNKPMNFMDNLKEQAAKTKDFAVLVNRLIAGGLNQQSLQQVLDAGVEAGSLIAEELLSGADNILAVNTIVADLQKVADEVGLNAATTWYQAGVDSGQELVNGIQAAIDKYMPLLNSKTITLSGILSIKSQFESDVATLTAVPSMMPDFSNMTAGEINDWISAGLMNLPNIGPGAIPLMADGGIVTRPTLALIGEGGESEAVIPLSRLGDMGGGGITITVNAGLVSSPDQVGAQIVEAIQKYQRRSGTVFAPA